VSRGQERTDALRAALAYVEHSYVEMFWDKGRMIKPPTWALTTDGELDAHEILRRGRIALAPQLTTSQAAVLEAVRGHGRLWYWAGGYWLPEKPPTPHAPVPAVRRLAAHSAKAVKALCTRGQLVLHKPMSSLPLRGLIGYHVRLVD
jgi:hypothetical protein